MGLYKTWPDEQATMQLRWMDGVLEQLWIIQEAPGATKLENEWRPVPSFQSASLKDRGGYSVANGDEDASHKFTGEPTVR